MLSNQTEFLGFIVFSSELKWAQNGMLKIITGVVLTSDRPSPLGWRRKMEMTFKLISWVVWRPAGRGLGETGAQCRAFSPPFCGRHVTAANDIGTSAEHTYGVHWGIAVLKVVRPCVPVIGMVETNPSPEAARIPPEAFREHLRKLDRRQWWLWSSTVLILMLLTIAVASFAFPAMLSIEQVTYSFYLNQAVRALVGIVLVFSVYVVYQQTMIMRMRNQLADQIQSLARVQSLTDEVYKLAALDQLTGLYNRRSGEQRLAEEISRAVRHERPLTILLIDLDGLKQINDRLGHAAGDLVLKSFSDRLRKAIRGSDLAVRLGGDEFMVLLPECRADEVRHVLNRLEGLDVQYEGTKIPCKFSRGWTDYKPGETAEELMRRGDEALYENKRAGKKSTDPSQSKPVPQPTL
jgi:diguanylate cyclase (GGDEF)-like protein